MKKLVLLVLLILLLVSGQTFAVTEITSQIWVGGSAVGQSFSPSNHVTISAEVHATNGYVLYSWHSNGNRRFGTDNRANTIYWRDGANLINRSLADHINANYVWPSPWVDL